MKTWLIIDSPYLCWRSYHAFKSQLTYQGNPVDVLYGFLRDILILQDQHASHNLVFCFDRKPYKRSKVYSVYKNRSGNLSDDVVEEMGEVRRQIHLLRTELLLDLGYRNVFHQKGYEADDCIASVVKNSLDEQDFAVIISADKDLYQLLSARVIVWNPDTRKRANPGTSEEDLKSQYGVTPDQWAEVKAIAGCDSDNIKGIKGVGELTAAKYITRRLKPTHKIYQSIVNGYDVARTNLSLVTLPWPGVKTFSLVEDETCNKKWKEVCVRLGFKSLLAKL